MVSEVTDQNFEKEVLQSDLPVLVDFWAPWCGPCNMVSPVVEKLSEDYSGKFKFCKINIDEALDTASKYNVMSIPTLMFFQKGKNVDQIFGAVPQSVIKPKIKELLLLSNKFGSHKERRKYTIGYFRDQWNLKKKLSSN